MHHSVSDGTNVSHSQHVLVLHHAYAPTTATRALMAACGSGRPCSLLLALSSLPAQLALAALVLYIIVTGYLHPALPLVLHRPLPYIATLPLHPSASWPSLRVPYILNPTACSCAALYLSGRYASDDGPAPLRNVKTSKKSKAVSNRTQIGPGADQPYSALLVADTTFVQ